MCPNGHDSKTPSLALWSKNNRFKCFGCGASGGPIGLVMLTDSVPQGKFRHACEFISKHFAITMPDKLYNRTEKKSTIYDFDDKSVIEEFVDESIDYSGLIPPYQEDISDKEMKDIMANLLGSSNIVVGEATQGTGKTYAVCLIMVDRIKKGLSTIYLSRSHDELESAKKTLQMLMARENLDTNMIFHLMARRISTSDETTFAEIPSRGPVIIVAPHVYMGPKQHTGYHYPLVEKIRNRAYGNDLLVVIDEVSSALDWMFTSFPLGARYTSRLFFNYNMMNKNAVCPLTQRCGNCQNCKEILQLKPRNAPGGLVFEPIWHHQEGDRFVGEEPAILKDAKMMEDIKKYKIVDKTLVLYYMPITNRKEMMASREWSPGTQGSVELNVSLNTYIQDLTRRLVSPHLVIHWPYNIEKKESLERVFNSEELALKQEGILPSFALPVQTCGIYNMQGWDSFFFEALKAHEQDPTKKYFAKLLMIGPRLSIPQKLFVEEVFRDDVMFFRKDEPYMTMKKVLILSFEDKLPFSRTSIKNFIQRISNMRKILFFTNTMAQAQTMSEMICDFVPTVLYNGEEHIRYANIAENLDYKIYMSYAHGPISQGVRRTERVVFVDTDTEIPKYVHRGGIILEDYKTQVLDHIFMVSSQCAGRIMREVPGVRDDDQEPRIIVFFGKHAVDVAEFSTQFFSKSGHTIKTINCEKNLPYVEEIITKWLNRQDIQNLEEQGVSGFSLEQIKQKIIRENVVWAKVRDWSAVKALTEEQYEHLKTWMKLHK